MRILLSYSKRHFDPNKKINPQRLEYSSAGTIAQGLYKSLQKIGKVDYIDFNEQLTKREVQYDLFVGIVNNFSKIVNFYHPKKTILIAVNMNPRERNKRLLSYIKRNKLGKSSIAKWDIQPAKTHLKSIKEADIIFCFGNSFTYNSYVNCGTNQNKIKMFNYGSKLTPPAIKQCKRITNQKKRRFLYLASEIGLRKGFDLIQDIFIRNKYILNKIEPFS